MNLLARVVHQILIPHCKEVVPVPLPARWGAVVTITVWRDTNPEDGTLLTEEQKPDYEQSVDLLISEEGKVLFEFWKGDCPSPSEQIALDMFSYDFLPRLTEKLHSFIRQGGRVDIAYPDETIS